MESAPSFPFGVLSNRQALLPGVRLENAALSGLRPFPFLLTALHVWAVIITVVWWAADAQSVWVTPATQASAAMAG